MDKSKRLGTEKLGPLLVRLSLPAIVGMLVNACYNMVDRIFIGQKIGSLALTGLTISFPVMIICLAFAMLIGVGGTALISINLGKQERDAAEKVLGNAFLLMLITGILLSVVGLVFLDQILILFNASDTVLTYSRQYLGIILFGVTFQIVSFGVNRFIGAEGNAMMAMVTMLIGAITNIILDALFIIGFGMGIQGAALATIIAQGVSAIWALSYFLRGKSVVRFHLKNFKLDPHVVGKIFAIGSAPFAMQLASSCIVLLYNWSLKHYGGDLAISAFGIINSIAMLFFMPVFGINQGCQPIIGYNYGAKQYDRVKKTLLMGSLAATVLVVLGFTVAQLAPDHLIAMFNAKDAELIGIGSKGMKIFSSMFPLIGFQVICSNYFQAVGKPMKAMLLSLTRQVIFLIPLILLLPLHFGLAGVWLAAPVSDLLSSVVTSIFITKEMRILKSHKPELVTG